MFREASLPARALDLEDEGLGFLSIWVRHDYRGSQARQAEGNAADALGSARNNHDLACELIFEWFSLLAGLHRCVPIGAIN
jgi:hypothetical protein